MKNLIGIIIAALALGGCSLFAVPNPVGRQQLAAVESTYGGLQTVAVAYIKLCDQRVIPNSCRTIVPQIQSAAELAQSKILDARIFIRNNPTLDAGSFVTLASSAVSTLQEIQVKYNLKTVVAGAK